MPGMFRHNRCSLRITVPYKCLLFAVPSGHEPSLSRQPPTYGQVLFLWHSMATLYCVNSHFPGVITPPSTRQSIEYRISNNKKSHSPFHLYTWFSARNPSLCTVMKSKWLLSWTPCSCIVIIVPFLYLCQAFDFPLLTGVPYS